MGAWNQGHWFEFESKMASATNVVFMDDCIMDVVFLTLLTHKYFHELSSSPFLPLSCSIVFISLAGHIYLIKSLCIGFAEFNKSVMC